jgi:hypothetical protein
MESGPPWIGDVVPYEHRQAVLARFLIGQIIGLTAGVWLGGFARRNADRSEFCRADS